MKLLSFKRHRFPAEIIRPALWLLFRCNLSLRDLEELRAQRGIDISYDHALLDHQDQTANREAAEEALASTAAMLAPRRSG